MKMLVTKLSHGKYRNEGELFAEPISADNVKLMGEMIALQALRNVMPYDFEVVSKLYNGLVKDLNRLSEIDYTITDGYDYAQTAICFLYQFKGMCVNDVYGKDKAGKYITIKNRLLPRRRQRTPPLPQEDSPQQANRPLPQQKRYSRPARLFCR